jgi:CHAD domain-containing protein
MAEPSIPTDQREIEWQFDAQDLEAVAAWLMSFGAGGDATPSMAPPLAGTVPHVSLTPGQVRELHDTYCDTEDWRIHRAGFTLRIRRTAVGAEATLKSMAAGVDGLRDRREMNEPVPAEAGTDLAALPGPVGAAVRSLTGSRPLRSLFDLQTTRRPFALILNGAEVGEVTLDTTTVPAPSGGAPLTLRRIEVEVAAERLDEALPFVEALRAACGLVPAQIGKFAAGLWVHALVPLGMPELGPTAITPSMSTGEVVFAVLRRHCTAMLAHEPGTRLGEDAEELHDMRVAIRRLRTIIRLFKDALPARAQRLRAELGWIGRVLGEVRDQDVQLAQVRGWMEAALPGESAALALLLPVYERRREAARRRMLRTLDSRRYERLTAGLIRMLRRGPSRRLPAARRPIVETAPDLIERRFRQMRKAARRLTADAPPAAYHALRIRGKRLRYAVEAVTDIYGDPARKLIKRLVAVQDILGEMQDAHVAITHLHTLALDRRLRLPPEAMFAMGRLAERYAVRAAELQQAYPAAYERLRGKRWRRLRRVMDALRPRPAGTGAAVAAIEG